MAEPRVQARGDCADGDGAEHWGLAAELGTRREMLLKWRRAYEAGVAEALNLPGQRSGTPLVSRPAVRHEPADELTAARQRIAELERKVGQQQLDLDFSRSLAAHRRATAAEQRACRAGYYRYWPASAPRQEETALRDEIQRLSLATRSYGYWRITVQLRQLGFAVNRKRVQRLRAEDNLLCLRKPAFRPVTTQSDHRFKAWPNLARRLLQMAINQLRVADITNVCLSEAFAYLAVILDAFSRRVIGWALSDRLTAEVALMPSRWH